MTTLLQEIEARIAAATEPVVTRHVGVIREVGDGVARVEGLGDTISKVDTVDCDKPHEAEVFATGELDPDRNEPYPDDEQQMFARVDRECAAVLADHPDVMQRFGVLPVVADERSWSSFRGRYVCVAIPYGGGTTEGSLGL